MSLESVAAARSSSLDARDAPRGRAPGHGVSMNERYGVGPAFCSRQPLAGMAASRGLTVADVALGRPEERRRYDELFEACPGAFIQQSSYWAEIIQATTSDVPLLLLCLRHGVPIAGLPLYLHRHPGGNILTSVPLPGPMGGIFRRDDLAPDDVDAAYALLLDRAVRLAQDHDCLTLTMITDPFRPDLERYERLLAPEYVLENFTQFVAVDEAVSGGRIVLPAAMRRSNLSRNLRRAEAGRFTVERCRSEEDLARWYEVHSARHRELGARPHERDLFRHILRVLEPRGKAHLLLVKHGQDIASGALYIYHRHVLDVYMLSMNAAFAEQAPNFLNTRASLLEAAEAGVRVYNWQSSPSRASGVFRYKAQWGSREAAYAFVTRRLCDPERLWAIGADGIRDAYAGHYVLPFAALAERAPSGRFRK